MICILGLGVLQAIKGFSGIDPLKISPSSIGKNLLASDSTGNFISNLLSFSPSSLKDLVSSNPKPEPVSQPTADKTTASPKSAPPKPHFLFNFGLIADSHTDITDLKKAVAQMNGINPRFVIGLGDYSDVGTVDELRNTKIQFDILKNALLFSAGGSRSLGLIKPGLKRYG